MDVLVALEGLEERRLLREVGEDPELDLGVVGGDEAPAGLGHEGLTDPPAELGADRDVLEVRVAR